jgi:hypothetical protein
MLNERTLETGFKVYPMEKDDQKLSNHEFAKDDIIQIMFRDISILWNLEKNQEVGFYHLPS